MSTPEQIVLELSETDRLQSNLARAMGSLSVETAELIATHKWPDTLELKCAPYPGDDIIPPYPPEAFPQFKAVRQSDRVYDITTRIPFMGGHSTRRVMSANHVEFRAEAPPPNEWGWRLSLLAMRQLYWCDPERIPPLGEHAARNALSSLSVTVGRLRQRQAPVPHWPMYWHATRHQS